MIYSAAYLTSDDNSDVLTVILSIGSIEEVMGRCEKRDPMFQSW
jgi:hypothetical protein